MQLTPRYDGPAILQLERPAGDLAATVLRQRQRLASALDVLDDEQWAAPSRCEGWTVQDVVAHLIGTNQFWALSVRAGLAGEPTRYLAAFDPVATPAQMVGGLRSLSSGEVLDDLRRTNDELGAALAAIEPAQWDLLAEAPPGHVSMHALARHALWDSWIHERDVLLPLGLHPTVDDEEVIASLTYVAALGPTLAATRGSTREGTLVVAATDPNITVVVRAGATVDASLGEPPAGAAVVRGGAVELVEALSFRAPFDHGLDADDAWLLSGLDEAFDRPTVR